MFKSDDKAAGKVTQLTAKVARTFLEKLVHERQGLVADTAQLAGILQAMAQHKEDAAAFFMSLMRITLQLPFTSSKCTLLNCMRLVKSHSLLVLSSVADAIRFYQSIEKFDEEH